MTAIYKCDRCGGPVNPTHDRDWSTVIVQHHWTPYMARTDFDRREERWDICSQCRGVVLRALGDAVRKVAAPSPGEGGDDA